MSPTKPSDSYKAVDYSSTAPTEVVSNNANSSGGGSLEPNETQSLILKSLQPKHTKKPLYLVSRDNKVHGVRLIRESLF